MRKDSLDMTDEDRKKVYNAIKSLSDDKIIVTH
jgi:L-asparaginase/Glu-tRNA(Gln) amidotransferase subunit D